MTTFGDGDVLAVVSGTVEQAAEKVDSRCPAPKGASDFEGLAVSLKRYPDTKHEFFRKL
jgi:hypothetical protein